jgi:hypothetical protein
MGHIDWRQRMLDDLLVIAVVRYRRLVCMRLAAE